VPPRAQDCAPRPKPP